jgi:hypothetical protein
LSGGVIRGLTSLKNPFVKGLCELLSPVQGSVAAGRFGAIKIKRGKEAKIMGLTDAGGLPISAGSTSSNPREVTLVDGNWCFAGTRSAGRLKGFLPGLRTSVLLRFVTNAILRASSAQLGCIVILLQRVLG